MVKNDEYKERIITAALDTESGKVALAQAMREPIKIALMYQGIARKLLMVDELPQGAFPWYERDIAVRSHVVSKRGKVEEVIVEAEHFAVPTFVIAAYPTITLPEIRARRFYIIDRAQVRAKDAIMRAEDREVFRLISAATRPDHQLTVAGSLDPSSLTVAFRLIEEHELVAAKVVMNFDLYSHMRNWGNDFFDPATKREVISTGLFGHIWTADVHVSTMVPYGTAYILAAPDFVGVMPIRQDITILPADDPKTLRIGWVIYEELGMAIVNDYAVASVTVV